MSSNRDILRTSRHMKVSDGSFFLFLFFIFHDLSFDPNLY